MANPHANQNALSVDQKEASFEENAIITTSRGNANRPDKM